MTKDDIKQLKAHACTMVIAWIVFASTGILIARYYKYLFRETICKIKLWFLLHLPLMIVVPLASIAAFVLVLDYRGWTWVTPSGSATFIHSIFGVVAFGLVILQPIFAMLRPKPEHKFRFIFNYFHKYLGIFIFTLAITAIYMGTFLRETHIGIVPWVVMGCWIGWYIFIYILMDFLEIFCLNKKKQTVVAVSDSLTASSANILERKDHDQSSGFEWLKILILCMHLMVSSGTAAVLVVYIIRK